MPILALSYSIYGLSSHSSTPCAPCDIYPMSLPILDPDSPVECGLSY